MPALNLLTIEGHLGRNAEIRTSKSGVPYTKFSVAVNRQKKVGDKWENDGVTWFNVTAFNKLAEAAADLRKGEGVYVQGPVSVSVYTPRDGGEPRGSLEVLATKIYRGLPVGGGVEEDDEDDEDLPF